MMRHRPGPATASRFAVVLLPIAVLFGENCSDRGPVQPEPPKVFGIAVSVPTLSLSMGDTAHLPVTVSVSGGASQAVTWTAESNPAVKVAGVAVATVSDAGLIVAQVVGTARICATAQADTTKHACAVATVRVPSFVSITTGGTHACGLTSSGAAYCWGDNFSGELGDGTTSKTPRTITAVSGGLTFSSIAAGGHTCGITRNGTAYCWGANPYGELGDGTTTDRAVPTAVAGGLIFRTIFAGRATTCGLTSAGAAYCWGYIVGDANGQQRSTPTAVAGGLSFTTISIGDTNVCAIAVGASAYCWGDDWFAQNGDGGWGKDVRLAPGRVVGGIAFDTISASYVHTCALAPTGAAYCWGVNPLGQFGDGTIMPPTGEFPLRQTTPTPVLGGLVFSAITTGIEQTCGLTNAGAAYCWGWNQFGQLGDGTTTDRLLPTPVAGGLVFRTVSANLEYACGVTFSGATYCWGDNTYGQLGDGTAVESRSLPTLVSGGLASTTP